MIDDVIMNKVGIIKRCIQRIMEEYGDDFMQNYTKQDSIILNIQRACEAAIAMGNRVIRIKQLAPPQSSRDVFVILAQADILSQDTSQKMQNMVGLRNIAIYAYQTLNLDIVKAVVAQHLHDFNDFSDALIKVTTVSQA